MSQLSIHALQSTEIRQTESSSKTSIQNEVPAHAGSCEHRHRVIIREEINLQRCCYFQQLRLPEQVRFQNHECLILLPWKKLMTF